MANKALRLPRLLSDSMILQREVPLTFWGWSLPEDSITISFIDRIYRTNADKNGRWRITAESIPAGGPYTMTVDSQYSGNETLKDILIGDVWLCSGQSNMVLPMERVKDTYPEELESGQNNAIRIFTPSQDVVFGKPLEDLSTGRWLCASPETIREFSATAYFFQQALFQRYSIPIGVINCSVGGSPIEAWLGQEMLGDFSQFHEAIEDFNKPGHADSYSEENEALSRNWLKNAEASDTGLSCSAGPWFTEATDTSQWQSMSLPAFFRDAGLLDFSGVIWFKKTFTLQDAPRQEDASLWLGTLVDSDRTYINGVLVGETGYQYPPRKYTVPAGLLRQGENEITVRVVVNNGLGRFTPRKPYRLFWKNGHLALHGIWKYQIGCRLSPMPEIGWLNRKPTGLYNGMLAPCHFYAIKGAVWYQGESNSDDPTDYLPLLKTLIAGWREKWNQGDFPFLIVQLPNFAIDLLPESTGWPEIREAQRRALQIPRTGLVVTIDTGEANDLHPENKKPIGQRLALAAQALAYGEPIIGFGPLIKSGTVSEGKIILSFDYALGGLLCLKGIRPEPFQIAGRDGEFKDCPAEIRDDQIIIPWEGQRPLFVRYAYAANPDGALFYNRQRLPASPFLIELD